MNVFAMSLITNECVTSYDEDSEANHEEVLDVGRMRQDILRKYVSRLVHKFAEFENNRSPWKSVVELIKLPSHQATDGMVKRYYIYKYNGPNLFI